MISIRPEQADDQNAIYRVNERAFNTSDEALLVDQLRQNGKVILSLVAVHDGQVVGHILFSPIVIATAGRTIDGVGLAPMAVLPEFQNQGIGSQLVKAGLDACR